MYPLNHPPFGKCDISIATGKQSVPRSVSPYGSAGPCRLANNEGSCYRSRKPKRPPQTAYLLIVMIAVLCPVLVWSVMSVFLHPAALTVYSLIFEMEEDNRFFRIDAVRGDTLSGSIQTNDSHGLDFLLVDQPRHSDCLEGGIVTGLVAFANVSHTSWKYQVTKTGPYYLHFVNRISSSKLVNMTVSTDSMGAVRSCFYQGFASATYFLVVVGLLWQGMPKHIWVRPKE